MAKANDTQALADALRLQLEAQTSTNIRLTQELTSATKAADSNSKSLEAAKTELKQTLERLKVALEAQGKASDQAALTEQINLLSA